MLQLYQKKMFRIILAQRAGFFSNVFGVLKQIKNAEINYEIPVVFWNKKSLYYDEKYGKNAWELYFEPVSSYSLKDVRFWDHKTNVIGAGWFGFELDDGKTLRETINRCWNEYIRIKSHIIEKINKFYDKEMRGRHCLGVHIRQTDRSLDKSTNIAGGGFVGLAPYKECIARYLHKYGPVKILLATDSENAKKEISSSFPGKVICYDSIRSVSEISIHGGMDRGLALSPYKKGEDVLIETMLLSKCNFLIRGTSNVSTMSLCVNTSLKFLDLNELLNNCTLEYPVSGSSDKIL